MWKYGTTGWATVGTTVSAAAGAYTQISASNTIKSLFAANEEDYPLFDMQIQVTTNTPTEGNILDIMQRPKADGTNEQPAPQSGFQKEKVGEVMLDNALGYYYGFNMLNKDNEATFYVYSREASTTLYLTVAIRMKDYAEAP